MRVPEFADVPAYYRHVRHGYDLIAGTYDDVEARNAVGRRLRTKIQDVLFRRFHDGDRVLEIGCGTGIDAIALAEKGVHVVATDISTEMLDIVRKKAEERGLDNLVTHRLAAHEIDQLARDHSERSFDGAYSHGGVLNMDPRIDRVAVSLSNVLRPSASFICTVVNQTSLFEVLFYPVVLRPRKAFRRLGRTIPLPITRHPSHRSYVVQTRFYSPKTFFAPFQASFRLKSLQGLQIVLPPWNLSDYVDRLPELSRLAAAIEDRISHVPPFRGWGSLFLMDLERIRK